MFFVLAEIWRNGTSCKGHFFNPLKSFFLLRPNYTLNAFTIIFASCTWCACPVCVCTVLHEPQNNQWYYFDPRLFPPDDYSPVPPDKEEISKIRGTLPHSAVSCVVFVFLPYFLFKNNLRYLCVYLCTFIN